MSFKPYRFAADCPNCGQKDQEGKWMGARMGSSRWGHDHLCCSEKCGVAFATSPKRFVLEKQALLHKRAILDEQLRAIEKRALSANRQGEK